MNFVTLATLASTRGLQSATSTIQNCTKNNNGNNLMQKLNTCKDSRHLKVISKKPIFILEGYFVSKIKIYY